MSGVKPYIYQYLEARADEVRDYGDYWSASSAGYCMRLNILRRLKVPPVSEIAKAKARTQGVFEVGHAIHAVIQGITKETGVSLGGEEELIDDDIMVKGHFDDLLDIDGVKILYDYKTANSMSFNFPKPEMGHYHKSQLRTYLYMVNKVEKFPRVLEGRILTIDRDNFRLKEHRTDWNKQAEKQIVDYWSTLNGYWDNKVLPECTCLDHDGGFMGRRSKKGKIYNDYFFNERPCNIEWATQFPELLKGWKYE